MKKTVFLLFLGLLVSCKPQEKPKTIPMVTTGDITEITTTTATCTYEVTDDGGAEVTTRGVCWSTSEDPTTADSKTEDGTGLGEYTSNITTLTPNITYYVRAHATNSEGTAYGEQKSFKTNQDAAGDTFTDSRDSNVYKTVTIGSQTWMAENLKYLPSVVGPGTWSETQAYYYVNGYDGTDVAAAKAHPNYTPYGVLYNWPAAMAGAGTSDLNPSGVRGICPAGWHLPSDDEWTQLETFLADNGYNYDGSTGGSDTYGVRTKIAKSLASESGWNSYSETGTVGNTDCPEYRNKSGFTALPGGIRYSDCTFYYVGLYGYWWSSTEDDSIRA